MARTRAGGVSALRALSGPIFKALLASLGLVIAASAFAAELRPGAIVVVPANAIWFEEAAQLEEWQRRRQAGDAKALAAYQEDKLHAREAWQFLSPIKVRVIGVNRTKHRVYVETLAKGRFEGLNWFIDDGVFRR